jgi:hypothetical protein
MNRIWRLKSPRPNWGDPVALDWEAASTKVAAQALPAPVSPT